MTEKNENFMFISYAHKDKNFVHYIIEGLKKKNFNVWYDKGIEAGTEWTEYIAGKIIESRVVLVFLSANALESQNCRREINYAIKHKKEMLVAYLEELELSPGMDMQLSILQDVRRINFNNDEAFLESLVKARILLPCKSSKAEKLPEPQKTEGKVAEIPTNEDKLDSAEFSESKNIISAEIKETNIKTDKPQPTNSSNVNAVAATFEKPKAELLPAVGDDNKKNAENKPATPFTATSTKKSEKPIETQNSEKSSTSDLPNWMTRVMARDLDPDDFKRRLEALESDKKRHEERRKLLGSFDIRKVIDEYNADAKYRIYYKKSLKDKQIENALKYIVPNSKFYAPPKKDDVVALMDMTVLSSGKEGFLFFEEMLVYRYMDSECIVDLGDIIDIKKTNSCTVFYMYNGEVLGIKNSNLFDVYRFAEILLKHRGFKNPEKDLSDRPECRLKKAICYANRIKSGEHFKINNVFHFGDNLTQKQKLNALKHIVKTKSDRYWEIVALLDMSKNKTGKEGLLVMDDMLYDTYAGGSGPIYLDSMVSVSQTGNKLSINFKNGEVETKDYSPYSDMVYGMLTYILKRKGHLYNRAPLPYEQGLDERAKKSGIPLPEIPYVANAIEKYNIRFPKRIKVCDFVDAIRLSKIIAKDYRIESGNVVGSFEGMSYVSYLFTKNAIYWKDRRGDEAGALRLYGIRGIKEVKNSHLSIVSTDGTVTGIKAVPDLELLQFIAAAFQERGKGDVNLRPSNAAFAASLANNQIYKDYYIPGNVKMFRFKTNIPLSKKNVFRTVVEPDWVLDNYIAYSDTSDGKGETGCWVAEKGMYCIASGEHHSIMYDRIESVKINGNTLSITYKDSTVPEIINAENAELIYRFLLNLMQKRAEKTT